MFDSPSDQKRLDKELSFYKILSEENIEMESTYKVEKSLSNNLFKYLMPLISIFLVILIFSEDIENETLSLFMTTKKSLSKLFIVKSFVYLSIMTSIVISLAFVTFFKTGFSTLPIHAMSIFKDVVGNVNILSFIGLESLRLFVNSLIAGFGLLAVFIVFKNQALAFIGIISLYFIEAIMYLLIPVNSSFAYLKYYNVFYLSFIDRLQFMTINNSINLFLMFVLIFVFLTSYSFYRIYKRFNVSVNKGVSLRTTNLNFQSVYQLLINYRGIIMITIVILFSLYNIQGFSVSTRSDELSYQMFKENYLGPITESLEIRVNEEVILITDAQKESINLREYINKHPEEANKLYAEKDHVFKMANDYENIIKLQAEIESAKELKIEALVDTRGTDLLFMKNQSMFLLQNMLVLIIPILIFGFYQGLHSFNKQNLSLVYTSKKGLNPYLRSRQLALIILSFISVLTIMGLHFFKISSHLPLDLSVSLKQQMVINIDVPLGIGFVGLYLLLALTTSMLGILSQSMGRVLVKNKI